MAMILHNAIKFTVIIYYVILTDALRKVLQKQHMTFSFDYY